MHKVASVSSQSPLRSWYHSDASAPQEEGSSLAEDLDPTSGPFDHSRPHSARRMTPDFHFRVNMLLSLGPHSGVSVARKKDRHSVIRDLVESRSVASQEELRKLLRRRGWDVTQSTLSRDLHEMGLARIPTEDGFRYDFPDSETADDARATLEALLPALFRKVDAVDSMIVVKTVVGGAQPIAVALDAESLPDVVGTIAGDDTILIICRSGKARERLTRRIRKLAGDEAG